MLRLPRGSQLLEELWPRRLASPLDDPQKPGAQVLAGIAAVRDKILGVRLRGVICLLEIRTKLWEQWKHTRASRGVVLAWGRDTFLAGEHRSIISFSAESDTARTSGQ